MQTIHILTFGVITEIVGKTNFSLSNIQSTTQLRERLEGDYPALQQLSYAVAVNRKIAAGPATLPDQCTVALLPPFSGG